MKTSENERKRSSFLKTPSPLFSLLLPLLLPPSPRSSTPPSASPSFISCYSHSTKTELLTLTPHSRIFQVSTPVGASTLRLRAPPHLCQDAARLMSRLTLAQTEHVSTQCTFLQPKPPPEGARTNLQARRRSSARIHDLVDRPSRTWMFSPLNIMSKSLNTTHTKMPFHHHTILQPPHHRNSMNKQGAACREQRAQRIRSQPKPLAARRASRSKTRPSGAQQVQRAVLRCHQAARACQCMHKERYVAFVRRRLTVIVAVDVAAAVIFLFCFVLFCFVSPCFALSSLAPRCSSNSLHARAECAREIHNHLLHLCPLHPPTHHPQATEELPQEPVKKSS